MVTGVINQMEIKSIVFCDSTQQVPAPDGNKVTMLINPTAVLTPRFIPGMFSFAVAFCVRGMTQAEAFEGNVRLCDPDGKDVSKLEMALELPENYQSLTCCVDFRNVVIEREGIYRIEITVAGKMATETVEIRKLG